MRPNILAKVHSPGSSDLRTEADFSLVNQLLRTPRYDIPEHLRKKVVECISDALNDDENEIKLKLEAIKVLSALDQHNIALIKLVIPRKIETINPAKMDDDELEAQVRKVLTLLPPPSAIAEGEFIT